MSIMEVKVVKVKALGKHPNADNLSITHVYDYPVITRTGDFKEGDKAVYVPVDAVVKTDDPRFSFLKGHNCQRIKARKLRGIFSMGLLIPADPEWQEGEDVSERLGITKYEQPIPVNMGGDNESDPGFIPKYTEIENIRRWPDILIEGEDVVISEKLHGTNARFVFKDGRLWVGSHNTIKKESPNSLWWKAARQYELDKKLRIYPGCVFYGEIYGSVQDLKYGTKQGEIKLAIFDIYSIEQGRYADQNTKINFLYTLGLEGVPTLYSGPWSADKIVYTSGKSTLADHIREGIVIKPTTERYDERVGRVVFKSISEEYLLRKDGTENH